MLDTTTKALDAFLIAMADDDPQDVYILAKWAREDANNIGDNVGADEARLPHLLADFLAELMRERDLKPPSVEVRNSRYF